MDKLNDLVAEDLKVNFPQFNVGDRIRVHVRVIEGDKERIQTFEGNVISIKGSGVNRTFTVRKIASGVGVERIFPFVTPKISKIDIVKQGKVRRAKLYYLRSLSGKAARIKDKNVR